MISDEPPSRAVAPLPVGQTIAAIYRLMVGNAAVLAKIAALPLILSLASDLALAFFGPVSQAAVRQAFFLVIWVPFADAALRIVLLNDQTVRRIFLRLRRRQGRLLGYSLLFGLLDLPLIFGWHAFVEANPTAVSSHLIYWVALIFLGFVKLRFAFVFPATAVEESYNLKHAWRHSQAVALPFFALYLILVVAPYAAWSYGLAEISVANASNHFVIFPVWLVWHAGVWGIEAANVMLIAVAFRQATGWVPSPDPAVLERFE